TGVLPILIATDAIAVIVHATNPVEGLSSDMLRDIFAGRMSRWSSVGGLDLPIHVVSREEGSGTRSSFDELVMGGTSVTSSAVVQDSNGSILETVASDPQAVGYVSFGLVDLRVKALAVDGVKPGPASARDGTYGIVRPFLFVTREQPTGIVKEFVDFVVSERGQSILEDNGLIRAR
ncbi:MAG: phosphate ABC transporter substrate-binding protein, partial [Firmicutes bacterium]|nr:phosphate ABC transporter substrate-binding protein [Bacillota bacterium]